MMPETGLEAEQLPGIEKRNGSPRFTNEEHEHRVPSIQKPMHKSDASSMSQDTTLHHPSTPSEDFDTLKALDIVGEYALPPNIQDSSDGLTDFALSPPSEQDEAGDNQGPTSIPFAAARFSPITPTSTTHHSRKRKQLSVIDQKHSDGKLLYMAARPNHFSYGRLRMQSINPTELTMSKVPTLLCGTSCYRQTCVYSSSSSATLLSQSMSATLKRIRWTTCASPW